METGLKTNDLLQKLGPVVLNFDGLKIKTNNNNTIL